MTYKVKYNILKKQNSANGHFFAKKSVDFQSDKGEKEFS